MNRGAIDHGCQSLVFLLVEVIDADTTSEAKDESAEPELDIPLSNGHRADNSGEFRP